jgi:uncharacterized protein YcfL
MKKLTIFLILAITLSLLTGCNSSDDKKTSTSDEATINTTTTLLNKVTTTTQDESENIKVSEEYSSQFETVTQNKKEQVYIYDEYGTEYEKVWKSKDNKITFTNDNKLGLDGRGDYEGILSFNDTKTKIDIGLENYGNLSKKYDGQLIIYIDIYEDGDMVGDPVLAGYYIRDDKNNEFSVTVNHVKNKYKSGYKKGDKIVFYQVNK